MTDRKVKEYLINMDSMNERENLQYQLIKIHDEINYHEEDLIHNSLSQADRKHKMNEIQHLRERQKELEEKLGLR